MTYRFWCDRVDGNKKIDEFLGKAYNWYCEEMKLTEDHWRYEYNLTAMAEPVKKDRRVMGGEPNEDDTTEKAMKPRPLT